MEIILIILAITFLIFCIPFTKQMIEEEILSLVITWLLLPAPIVATMVLFGVSVSPSQASAAVVMCFMGLVTAWIGPILFAGSRDE